VYNGGSCKYEEISGLWMLEVGILNVVLTFSSLVVTLHTTRFNIQQFCMVFTLLLCVVCVPQNKQTFALYDINKFVFYNRWRKLTACYSLSLYIK